MAFFESSLCKAIKEGDVVNVEDFLKHGLSVNYVFKTHNKPDRLGKSLLDLAVSHRQYEVVRLLCKYKCDPNLTHVVDVEDHCLTIKPYTKRQRLRMTNMYPCIVKGDIEMIRILVSAGFDVNLRDERDCTAIWHAVDMDNYQMAKALTSLPGCDVNIRDTTHLYPLHVAALHQNVKIASLLIRRGAHVDVLTVRGSTPLILACKFTCYDLVRLLLLNGANPNHRGINGHTPISAVLENCSDCMILDLLVDAGASIDFQDVRKCLKDKLPLLKTCPEVLNTLKTLASMPRSLKMLCCLSIRKSLLAAKTDLHLVHKVQQLPLPNIVKEFLLLNFL